MQHADAAQEAVRRDMRVVAHSVARQAGASLGPVRAYEALGLFAGALWRRAAQGRSERPGLPKGDAVGPRAEALAAKLYRVAKAHAAATGMAGRSDAAATLALRMLASACERAVDDFEKANEHWRRQPRVPKFNPHGGRWLGPGALLGKPKAPRLAPGVIEAAAKPPRYETGHFQDEDIEGFVEPVAPSSAPLPLGDGFDEELRGRKVESVVGWLRQQLRFALRRYGHLVAIELAREVASLDPDFEAMAQGPRPLEKLRSPMRSEGGFRSQKAFEAVHGKAPEGYQWHHIIEQSQIGKGGITAEDVYSWENTVLVPRLLHEPISNYYSGKTRFSAKLPVRKWLEGKPKEVHIRFGIQVMRMKGVLR